MKSMEIENPETTGVAETELKSPWKRLCRAGAITTIVMIVVIQGLAGAVIPPLVVFGILYLVALVLLGRPGRAGGWMLAVLPVVFLAANAPFLFPQLGHPDTVADFVPSLIMVVAPIVTFIGALGTLRGMGPGGATKAIGFAAILVVVAAGLASGLISSGVEKAASQAGDVTLEAKEVEFAPEALEAEAGSVAVHITNVDPIRHTFTIDELDVGLELPGDSASRIEFEAAAGTYTFYCAVAGHEDMTGTLVIR